MAIYVQVEDPEGEPLAPGLELEALPKRFPKTGACLAFVDERDDARFNRAQAAVLLAELAALGELPAREKTELERLKAAVARLGSKPGSYVAFYGDFQ